MAWPLVKKRRNKRTVSWMVDCGMVDGKRVRYFFKEKAEAETKAEQLRTERRNTGLAAFSLSNAQRAEAADCLEQLRPFGKSLKDAVAYYLPHVRSLNQTVSFRVLIDELVASKKADGLSVRYVQDLKSRLGAFAADFGERLVASIESTELDNWLRSLQTEDGNALSATTRNNFRRVLGVAFNHAVKRKYCDHNPVSGTDEAKVKESEVGILKVDELKKLLAKSAPTLIPFVCIGSFAGLRRAELERLDWSEIDLEGGHIEVKASKAKSARRRLVRIRPNLEAWLKIEPQTTGPVTPPNYRILLDSARENAGLSAWPSNALRHSFASYCLAHEQNAAALALELGHTNSQLIFTHYREVVKPVEAAKYWEVLPASTG